MMLRDAYMEKYTVHILYDLLSERPSNSRISHQRMPNRAEHAAFFSSRPYRYWFLIMVDGEAVGDLHVTPNNEIGLFVFKRYQHKGYATEALKLFMSQHEPLSAIPAVRVARWIAHVNPRNKRAIGFFRSMGFKRVQETYAHD